MVLFGYSLSKSILNFYLFDGFGAEGEGFDGELGVLFPLPGPDGFPVVLGPFGGL